MRGMFSALCRTWWRTAVRSFIFSLYCSTWCLYGTTTWSGKIGSTHIHRTLITCIVIKPQFFPLIFLFLFPSLCPLPSVSPFYVSYSVFLVLFISCILFLHRPRLSGQMFTVMWLMLFVIIIMTSHSLDKCAQKHLLKTLVHNTGEELMLVGGSLFLP